MGWTSPETQRQRFLTLSLMGDLQDATVLDVGCGLGDFYGFLSAEGIRPIYTGVDLCAPFVSAAQSRYPDASFVTADFLSPELDGEYAYAMASGAFSFRMPSQWIYLETCVRKLVDLSAVGAGFNVLSSYTPLSQQVAEFYYYDPKEVLSLCLSITPYVELRHAYLPNDFTVFMYPG